MLVTKTIMCVCSFDMLFTFVYTGWEGTTNDSRVLLDVVTREDNQFPWPSEGEYNTHLYLLYRLYYDCFFFLLEK